MRNATKMNNSQINVKRPIASGSDKVQRQSQVKNIGIANGVKENSIKISLGKSLFAHVTISRSAS